jgi:hypothetical protein
MVWTGNKLRIVILNLYSLKVRDQVSHPNEKIIIFRLYNLGHGEVLNWMTNLRVSSLGPNLYKNSNVKPTICDPHCLQLHNTNGLWRHMGNTCSTIFLCRRLLSLAAKGTPPEPSVNIGADSAVNRRWRQWFGAKSVTDAQGTLWPCVNNGREVCPHNDTDIRHLYYAVTWCSGFGARDKLRLFSLA